jgi:hypothetical protein
MSADAVELAARIDASTTAFIALVEACADEQWRTVVADEGWPVGFVARHVGWGLRAHRRLIVLTLRGEELPDLTLADIDEANRRSLAELPLPDRDRTLRFLRRELAETLEVVGTLDAAALARTARLSFFRPQPVTVQEIIADLLLWHVESHAGGVRAAVA